MIKRKLVRYVRRHKLSLFSRCLTKMFYLYNGFFIFFCNFTGHIPSYGIRDCLYTRIFRVKKLKDSIIYRGGQFLSPDGVSIGHNSVIGDHVFLDGRRRIYIGNNVDISSEVRIYTEEHNIDSPSFRVMGGKVIIEDWVYIGARVIVLPNVTIGEGAVVASGAVVTKNIEPWTLVGGVPAHYIRKRPVVKYILQTKNRLFFQ